MNYGEIILNRSLAFKHMFQIFLFEGYLKRISKYLVKVVLFDITLMMSMINPLSINVETLIVNSRNPERKISLN